MLYISTKRNTNLVYSSPLKHSSVNNLFEAIRCQKSLQMNVRNKKATFTIQPGETDIA